jgi:hypothetical protein
MATTPYDPLGGYNTNPQTQYGSGAYGAVPGPLTIPPNVYQQLTSLDPGMFGPTGSLPSSIQNEFGGLSPETTAAIQQHAAQFGTSTGMPGSQFQGNYGLEQLGLGVEAQNSKAIKDAISYSSLTGSQVTPQATALSVASNNATMASAPNPQQAASQQMGDWQAKFNAAAGGAGGARINPSPAAGSGNPMGVTPASGNFAGGGAGAAPVDPFAGDISNPNSDWWAGNPAVDTGTYSTVGGYNYDPTGNTAQINYADPNANVAQYNITDPGAVPTTSGYQPTTSGAYYTGSTAGYDPTAGMGGIWDPTSNWWNDPSAGTYTDPNAGG